MLRTKTESEGDILSAPKSARNESNIFERAIVVLDDVSHPRGQVPR